MITSSATAAQISHYLHGSCQHLAAAIWEAIGWQWQQGWSLAIVTDDDGETGHVVIRTPDGAYLDIRGLIDSAELLADHPAAELAHIDADWLTERGWDLAYTEADLAAAQALCVAVGLDVDDDDWERAERYAL